ncbi:MAG: Do family serine endopeptidase [Myxococcota bacterium]
MKTKTIKRGLRVVVFALAVLIAAPLFVSEVDLKDWSANIDPVELIKTPEARAQSPEKTRAAGTYGMPAVSSVFEAQKSKVVAIKSEKSKQARGSGMTPFSKPGPAVGQGSGFVVDADGYILTNNHVVEGAEKVTVAMASGENYEAQVVGTDPKTDLALVKIEPDASLPAVDLGTSRDIKVGEWVVAIGNPFGLDYSVTAGIISAKGRNIGQGPYDNFLQTDASINPGNSGGPLFNLDGEVVGVNTAIIRGGQGIGFAVPIDMVKAILPQLKEQGYVTRGYMGAMLQELTEVMAESFGVEANAGVLVGSVEAGGPADKAGLEAGDIVTEFGGKKVEETQDLMLAVADARPETTESIVVLRDGERKRLNITLVERPDAAKPEVQPARHDNDTNNRLGVEASDIPRRLAAKLGQSEGVLVQGVVPGSPAARALRPGDIITQVGRTRVESLREFARLLKSHDTSEPLRLRVVRDGRGMFVAVRLDE